MESLNVPVGIPLIFSFSNHYLSRNQAGTIVGTTRPAVSSCSHLFGLCSLSFCRTWSCPLIMNLPK